MANHYQKTSAEVMEAMGVTTDGLSRQKAEELLHTHGENALAEGKKKTVLQVFLGQFADLLVLILIAAAIISMFSGNIESTIVIFAVIIMNAKPEIPVLAVRQGHPRRTENRDRLQKGRSRRYRRPRSGRHGRCGRPHYP